MAKKKEKTLEEKLQEALVPEKQWPYILPENWCWTRLENINKYRGKSVTPQNNDDILFELYSVPSCENEYPEILTGSKIGSSKQLVEKKDVLLCKINPRINRVWQVLEYTNNTLLASSEWIVVRNRLLNSDYLVWYFKSPYFRECMLSNVSGVGGSLMRAKPKAVMEYPVPLAPLSEQKRIVNRIESLFAKLDEAKEKIQQVLDGAEMRKAAILHKAFTGELTKTWRKENGISEDSWEVKKLKDITTPKAGFAFNSKKFTSEGYQIIRMGNLYGGKLDLDRVPVFYAPENIDEKIKKRAMLHDNDIVITLTGTKYKRDYGYAVLIKEPVNLFLNQRILALSPIEKIVNPTFLLYSLRSKDFRDIFFSNETGGVNQGNVSSKFVENIKIKIPLLEEQREIVKVLNHQLEFVDDTTKICKDAYEQIDTMKKSILAKAFRGKLGTNNPTEDSALNLLKEVLQDKF